MGYRESNNHATITNVWHHQKVSNFVSKRAISGYIRLIFATCRISEILTKPDTSKIYVLDSLLTRQIGFLYTIVPVYYPWTVGFHYHPCVHSSQSYTESAFICLEFILFVVCNSLWFVTGYSRQESVLMHNTISKPSAQHTDIPFILISLQIIMIIKHIDHCWIHVPCDAKEPSEWVSTRTKPLSSIAIWILLPDKM